nr:hypothetical protein [uncultured Tyzzerella sp.]
MDLFNLIFIFLMILGFIIIIISIVKLNKYSNSTPISNVDNYIKEMKDTIDQADLAIDDLNLMSEQIFKRFDEKQRQLLFLYETIEKKKAMSSGNVDIKIDEEALPNNKPKKKYVSNHPMANEIKELHKQNMSISDIAKTLNIGKGEVELIIKFGEDSL